MFKATWLDRGTWSGTTRYFDGCAGGSQQAGCTDPIVTHEVIAVESGTRSYYNGAILYHFRPEQAVHPTLGIGVGVFRNDVLVTCTAVTQSCDRLSGRRFGASTRSWLDLIAIAGVTARLTDHIVLRGGFDWHRPGGEDLSLFETLLAVGYRF